MIFSSCLVTTKNKKKKTTQNSPIKTAPDISQNVANQQAACMDNTPEPTLVPNELATSLAPIPNANIKAITKPTTTIHKTVIEYGSNILA